MVWLADALPTEMKVCIVADRGFGDHRFYQVLTEELKFDYVIRFRGNIHVTAADGEMRTAADWVGRGGRARVLRDALVTAERYQVGAVLYVQDTAIKQAWCCHQQRRGDRQGLDEALRQALGHRVWVSRHQGPALRHGHGIDPCQHPGTPRPSVAAQCLRHHAVDIAWRCRRGTWVRPIPQVKHYQTADVLAVPAGCMLYDLIPNMPEARLLPLIERFTAILAELPVFADTFGVV